MHGKTRNTPRFTQAYSLENISELLGEALARNTTEIYLFPYDLKHINHHIHEACRKSIGGICA
jgi:hypothetical protein